MKYFAIIALIGSLFIRSSSIAAAHLSEQINFESTQANLTVNQVQDIPLSLDTKGKATSGVDIVLSYDPSAIEVVGVTFATPQLYAHNFFSTEADKGRVRLTGTFVDVGSSYTGAGKLAAITVRALKSGTSELGFVCSAGKTDDTNLIDKSTYADLMECASLHPLTLTVASAQTTTAQTQTPASIPAAITASCTPTPQTPTGLTAKGEASALLLSWKSSGAKTHTVLYGTKAGIYESGIASVGNVQSFRLTSLRPSTKYYVAVASINDCGRSSLATAEATTQAGSPEPVADSTTPSLATLAGPADTSPVAEPNGQGAVNETSAEGTSPTQRNTVLFIALAVAAVVGVLALSLVARARMQVKPPVVPPQSPPPPIA